MSQKMGKIVADMAWPFFSAECRFPEEETSREAGSFLCITCVP